MQNQQFAGASKINTSFLSPLERRFAPAVLPMIPSWLQTYHLTMLTLLWSGLILFFSYLAAGDIRWLWLVSLMILFHYVTDHLDGKVGKHRNTGLLRWGYYMDHLLDYFFLCSVIIGYAFILPAHSRYQLLFMLAIFAGYEMSTFLAFAATDRLKISYLKFGPTEFRLALIVVNALLIQYGLRYMVSGLKYVNMGGLIGLAVLIYRTHKKVWHLDMEDKEAAPTGQPANTGGPLWASDRPDCTVCDHFSTFCAPDRNAGSIHIGSQARPAASSPCGPHLARITGNRVPALKELGNQKVLNSFDKEKDQSIYQG